MLTANDSRREFLKKSAYVVPTILSLNVALVEARASSMPDPNMGKGGSPPRGQRPSNRPPTRDTRDTRR